MPSVAVATPPALFAPAAAPQTMAAQLASPFAAQLAGMLATVPGGGAGVSVAAVTLCGPQAGGEPSAPGAADGAAAESGIAAATPCPGGAIPATPCPGGAIPAPTATAGEIVRPAQARSPSRRQSDAGPDADSTAAAASWPAGIALAGAFTPPPVSPPIVVPAVPDQATVSGAAGTALADGQNATSAVAVSADLIPGQANPSRADRPGARAGSETVGSDIATPAIQAALALPGTAPASRAPQASLPATAPAAPDAAATVGNNPAAPTGLPGRHRSARDTTVSTPAAIADTPAPPAGQHQAGVAVASPEVAQPTLPAGVTAAVGVSLTAASVSAGASAPATAAPAAASAAPAPAQQAMHALVSLGGSQGTRNVTVQLDPLELGRLQIRIEQPKDGPAQVTLTAERTQTLDLLVRDQAQLHHALDQAGVPAEGRSLTFHLAASQPDPQADASRSALPSAASGSAAGDLTGGGSRGGAQQGPQRDGYSAGQPRLGGGTADPQADIPRTAQWLRAGIDITA